MYGRNGGRSCDLPTKVDNTWIIDGTTQIQMIKKGDTFIFGELADIIFSIIQSLFRTEETVYEYILCLIDTM